MPAALPRTMSQLKALTTLDVSSNKLPSTDVDFIIESFPQLTMLSIAGLGLTGEHLCSTSTTPPHNFLHHRRREGPREGSPPQLRRPPPLRAEGKQRGGTQHGAARRLGRARARASWAG